MSIHGSCPIADLFEFLGKKRTIVIIKTLSEHDQMSFSDLQRALHNINSRILTERLDESVQKGYVLRMVTTSKPLKIRYALTEQGKKLWAKLCELGSFAKELEAK